MSEALTEDGKVNTLGDELPRQMARVRDELIPAYISIGPAGTFGLMMLRQALDRAAKAMAEGDIVQMVRSCKELQECQ